MFRRKKSGKGMDGTGEDNPPDTNTQKPDFEQWAGIAKPPPPTEKRAAPPEKTGEEAQTKILPFPPAEEQEEEDAETSPYAYGRYRLPGGG